MSKRKPNASSRPMPGSLVQSIQSEVIRENGEITGSVFVSENSKAKKYAKRIHDEKGVKWFERGLGTVAKGQRADEKFIERAMYDSEEKIFTIIESEINKALERMT